MHFLLDDMEFDMTVVCGRAFFLFQYHCMHCMVLCLFLLIKIERNLMASTSFLLPSELNVIEYSFVLL